MRTQSTDDILAARGKTHGDFRDLADIAQKFKNVMHAAPNWAQLPAVHREMFEMEATKMARALCGDFNNADHYADMQGYARLVERIIEQPKDAGEIAHSRAFTKPAPTTSRLSPEMTRPLVDKLGDGYVLKNIEEEIASLITK